MKEKFKIGFKILTLGVMCLLLVSFLSGFFQPTWLLLNNFYTTRSFYQEPKNKIETLFLGASVGAYAFSPIDLYRDYGICAFTIATQEQPIFASYYWLEETYRLHPETLKTVVFDVSEFRKEAYDSIIHKAFDGMKFSPVKLKAVMDYTDNDFSKAIAFLLPLNAYHSRWSELETLDFEKYDFKKDNGTRGYEFTTNTYVSYKDSFDEIKVLTTTLNKYAKPTKLKEEATEYFDKIHSFCKDKGIKLVLVKTPSNNWSSPLHNAVQLIADKYELDFFDFNFSPIIDEINYVHPYESREGMHTNYFGAAKIMKYLGEYLVKECDATDVRGNSDYAYMEDQLEMFNACKYKQFELSQTTDVAECMKTALTDNNTIFITVNDDCAKSLTDAQRKYFADVGLEKLSKIKIHDTYIGIIDNNGVLYEDTRPGKEKITYKGLMDDDTLFELESGAQSKKVNVSSCKINGEETSKNTRGINFTIYNNEYSEVIYSISFDTNDSATKDQYLADFGALLSDKEAINKYKTNETFVNAYKYKKSVEKNNKAQLINIIISASKSLNFINSYKNSNDYIVIISSQNDVTRILTEKHRKALKVMGLPKLSQISEGEAYVAYITGGQVMFEEKSEQAVSFEKDVFKVTGTGKADNQKASIMVNGKEYAKQKNGLNIAVYSKKENKIIRSVAF